MKKMSFDPVEKQGLPDNPNIEKKPIRIDPQDINALMDVLELYVSTYRPELYDSFKKFISSHSRNKNFIYMHYLSVRSREKRNISYQTYASKYFPDLLNNMERLSHMLGIKSMSFKKLEFTPQGIKVIE